MRECRLAVLCRVAIRSANGHRVSQAQPEIAAAGGSSGVAAAPGRALCFVREKAFILGVMGIGKGSLGGLPLRSPCPAGGSYPRVSFHARAKSTLDIPLGQLSKPRLVDSRTTATSTSCRWASQPQTEITAAGGSSGGYASAVADRHC